MSELSDNIMSTLNPDEQAAVKKILEEYAAKGTSKTLDTLYDKDYAEIPVDIDTFIESDEYAGWFTSNGKGVYPYWRDKLREMWNQDKNYVEIAITGGIGTGKTHIAVLALSYGLYRIMCLRDPVGFYGLNGDILYVVFFNATLQLSRGVAYQKFQQLLQHSPWFMARGKISGTKYLEYTPNGPIRFAIGSQYEHSLGRAVILGIMDELNFTKGSDIDFEKSRIMAVYASVLERIGSRFTINGKVMGKLFLVSSKKTEYDFIESYIRKQMGKPGIYVVDSKIWEVKPEGTYCGVNFRLAVGTSNLPSRIIPDNEDSEVYIAQGYEILEVPIEFKGRFELNMTAALMNVAGISVSNVTKFLAYPNIEKCIIPQKNPFRTNILTVGTKDNLRYQDFFEPELVPPEIYSKPLFVHFDCSLTGDKTGIGCVAVLGYTNRDGYDEFTGEHVEFKELAYRQVFAVGIQCPSGAEISFRKDREFIYYLKHELGWNIRGISLDSFQSADLKQSFITAGFDDTTIVSLDKKPDGYLTFRSTINERRFQLLSSQPELIKELVELKQDNQTGKVDHPIDGSKDMCLSYDTKLFLLSGKEVTIEDLYYQNDGTDWILACDLNNKCIKPVKIDKVIQKDDIPDKLYEITLDNGKSFKVTGNHLILCRDELYKRADELCVGESLMPFDVYTKWNYKNYYRVIVNPFNLKDHEFIYKLVVHTLKQKDYDDVDLSDGSAYRVIHHKDHNKLNDTPENLIPMSLKAHRKIHGDIFTRYNKSEKKKERNRELLKQKKIGFLSMDSEDLDKLRSKNGTINITKYNKSEKHKKRASEIGKVTIYNTLKYSQTEEARRKRLKTRKERGYDEEFSKQVIKQNKDEVIKHKQQIGKVLKAYNLVLTNSTLFDKSNVTFEEFIEEVRNLKREGVMSKYCTFKHDYDLCVEAGVPLTNHKIVSIKVVDNCKPVYDLQLSNIHNFGIDAGIFVHNCDGLAGAVYNASLHDGQFAFELVDNAMLFGEINDVQESETDRFVNGLLDDPAQAVVNRYNKRKQPEELPDSVKYAQDFNNGFLSW